MNRVVSKAFLSGKIAKLAVEAPLIVKSRRTGHPVIIRATDHSECIPYTIAGADVDADAITLIVQAAGESPQWFVALDVRDTIHNVVGLSGQATHIENFDTVVCAGGNVDTAPLYPIAKALKAAGSKVIVVIAARTKELIILEEGLGEFVDEVIIMTDDGSYGTKEPIADDVEPVIKREKVDLCVTIGPAIMIRFIAPLTKKYNVPTISSLNTIMADGTGMCGVRRIIVEGKVRFVCVDEPEFDTHQVDFDELLICLNIYRK